MNLIHYVTQTAKGIREQLKVFGNDYNTPYGTCIRDYIYVVDLAKAHVKAMARVLDTDSDKLEVFNIGTGHGCSTKEIVDAFQKATGVKLNWTYAPRRAGDVEKVWANPEKANSVLGWKADTSLEDTLKSAWNWQKKLREEGIQ
jgi:UDP-glucose 4-epimerase